MDTVHDHPGGAGAAIGAGHGPAPTSGTSQPPTRRGEPTRLLLPPPPRQHHLKQRRLRRRRRHRPPHHRQPGPPRPSPHTPTPYVLNATDPSLSATELDDASWHPPQPR